MLTGSSTYTVSRAYAADGKGPMVYGKYKEAGYEVNPITGQLGTFIPENVSASEAFSIAGLDWVAEKRPAFFMGPDGPVQSTEHCSIVRSDNDALLGIHGAGYTPVQNQSLINLLEYLREDIEIETVLSIRNGRRIFASARIHTEAEVVPGDRVRRYLHLFNGHDGHAGFGVFFSDVRLACANQLAYLTDRASKHATAAGNGLRRKHTASVTAFAEALPRLINLERRSFTQSLDELRSLSRIRLTPEITRRVLEATFADKLARPLTERGKNGITRPRVLEDLPEIETITSHLLGGTGYGMQMQGVNGTAYGLFNAVTQYFTHDAGRSKDDTERARARLEALWGGVASDRIDRAREACLALV